MIPTEYIGRYFFHMTDVGNLESILQHGLLCTNEKERLGIAHHSIANQSIQERRSEMAVPCGQGRMVHDYVPFYFCSRNPMLLGVINSKNQDQSRIIYLCFRIEKLESLHAVFTNASANTIETPEFYDNVDQLSNLDWDAISNQSWGCPDETYRHKKMAEVLVWNRVSISEIDAIVVYGDYVKNEVDTVLRKHSINIPVVFEPFCGYHFYYTKFKIKGQENITIVHGPGELKGEYERLLSAIAETRDSNVSYHFKTVAELLYAIEKKFTILPELKGIYQLETSNKVHYKTVSDHTLSVVKQIKDTPFYQQSGGHLRNLMELAAYFHDIGKGPKNKWEDGVQPKYPDHPADAIPMLRRIFTKEVECVTEEDIRRVCMMVVYHDLIGDICAKGRKEEQLMNIIQSEEDVDLLNAISIADAKAISEEWIDNTANKRYFLIRRAKNMFHK